MKNSLSVATIFALLGSVPAISRASTMNSEDVVNLVIPLFAVILILIVAILWVVFRIRTILTRKRTLGNKKALTSGFTDLDITEVTALIEARKMRRVRSRTITSTILIFLLTSPLVGYSQTTDANLFSKPGIVITLTLLIIPLVVAVIFLIARINMLVGAYHRRQREEEAEQLAEYLIHLDGEEIDASLLKRKESLERGLKGTELSGSAPAEDAHGVIRRVSADANIRVVPVKKKAVKRPGIDPRLGRLIIWYLGTAVFWLILGTTVGEYLGIKFVAPDVDYQRWLSFGRLRPVHTNAVFWGWSSLAMLGLGYYVVSIVSNVVGSIKKGWIALALINAAVIIGSVCLMAGINNGGGEYREYPWPVMALFGAGLVLVLINFLDIIAKRQTREIYISNWYIVSAIIFTIVIAFVAYWPTWQEGLGETIIQGYYMHQGVGMWFMLFTLGIVYYFLPQQLNKPIYSYSLGILAFWTQILFYTVIGTHHFVFSSIPWSLQTVAIVGSMGMVIPVVAGTTNFLLTMKGDFAKLSTSYTLPFFLVGIVFYFTGSFQGTAEAFRYTNLLWHFTDFTVAHSHMTMYGIIAFLLWGAIYALIPRLTGQEPSHLLVGAHFWLAFIGLLLYSVPLMIGGTLKGLLWMEGKPFIDSVTVMSPYWLWRAIGGSMMWMAHLIFAWNFYRMVSPAKSYDARRMAFVKLAKMQHERMEPELVN